MIHNLLLSGGQIRGLSYIGVLKALEELDLISDVYNICGVSSGSIFALAYCLGFKSHELKSIVMTLILFTGSFKIQNSKTILKLCN